MPIIEDTPFLSLILKTSVKKFPVPLDASSIGDFSGNHNQNLSLFFAVFKDCSVVGSYFETNIVLQASLDKLSKRK